MSSDKVKKTIRIPCDLAKYIQTCSGEWSLNETKTIEKIFREHRKNTDKDLIDHVARRVADVLKTDLTRVRLGTNNADKNSQVIIELLNVLFISLMDTMPATSYEFVSTEKCTVPLVSDAEMHVRERIKNFRAKKLERNAND